MAKDNSRIRINAFFRETTHYFEITVKRTEDQCSECGGCVVRKPYGRLFIPKALGLPSEILIAVKAEEVMPGDRTDRIEEKGDPGAAIRERPASLGKSRGHRRISNHGEKVN